MAAAKVHPTGSNGDWEKGAIDMKPRTIIPLVVGLGVGFFAIKMVIDMVQKAKGEQGDTKQVIVARAGIPGAVRITEAMLTSKEVPTALVPSGSFSDPKKVVGRVTKMTIPNGIVVSQNLLAPPGASPGLNSVIPPGLRAVSVRVDEASAVAGFVKPGDHVDVFAGSRGRGRNAGKSGIILSDIEVGAVGQSMQEVGPDGKTVGKYKSVTLFLDPELVPILDAASGSGRIRLALRGHSDRDKGPSAFDKLLTGLGNIQPVKAAPRPIVIKATPARRVHIVEVHNGSAASRVVFDEDGKRVRNHANNPTGFEPVSGIESEVESRK